jgi:hypothetical protein
MMVESRVGPSKSNTVWTTLPLAVRCSVTCKLNRPCNSSNTSNRWSDCENRAIVGLTSIAPRRNVIERASQFRQAISVAKEDTLLLQPTRVVARKGIEHSIELARALADKRCKLVISHATDDEGPEYAQHLDRFAQNMGVELIFAGDLIGADTVGNGE